VNNSHTVAGVLDLQVNGYDGVDFNSDNLDPMELSRACERLRKDGISGILATIITDELPAMCRRLNRLCEIREQDESVAEMIWGLHIEGPFLNEQSGFIGAHPAEAARPADVESMQRLFESAGGLARIVTLAPERDPHSRVTRWLVDRQVTVSAGHCDPTSDQLRESIDSGLTMFTHLGNGCPQMLRRHDNIIQRVLGQAEHLAIGFIADGIHVPWLALANYLKIAGYERSFVITDAISAAGRGPGAYRLGDQDAIVDDSLATWAADRSHLVGSAMTMPEAIRRLRTELSLSDDQIEQLTETNPRAAIGLPTD